MRKKQPQDANIPNSIMLIGLNQKQSSIDLI
jgi:hypothetical protein